MKISFNYSIFCDKQNISKSIRYLIPCVKNIKTYEENKLFQKNIDFIIYLDNDTLDVLTEILKQEKIQYSNIKFIIKPKNLGLRGMFWRLNGLMNDNYQINIVAEGDYDILNYKYILNYYLDKQNPILLVITRQFKISKNSIAGGFIMCKPNLVSNNIKTKFKSLIELFENIETIDYGVDEYFLHDFFCKNFKNENILFLLRKLKIRDHIENLEKEKNDIKEFFNKSTFIVFEDAQKNGSKINKIDFNKSNFSLHFLKENLEYCLNGKKILFEEPNRVSRSEFCQERLLQLINPLL